MLGWSMISNQPYLHQPFAELEDFVIALGGPVKCERKVWLRGWSEVSIINHPLKASTFGSYCSGLGSLKQSHNRYHIFENTVL